MANAFETLKSYKFRYFNIRLLIWVCALTVLGILVISSATESDLYESKQVFGFGLGMFIMFFAALFSYKFVLKFYWIFYIINLCLLIWVKVAGAYHMGATRWIDLGFTQLQPSEFSKIFLIIFFASYLCKYKDRINTLPVLGGAIVLFFVPLALILKQPDLSTSIVIVVVFCGILFMAGLNYKIILGAFAVMVPVAVVLVYLIMQPDQKILEHYQYMRLVGFYDEDNEEAKRINYQQENSVMAIGSGGLWGKGLYNDSKTSVKNGNYISEPQTDFIFCIAGEELGFVGSSAIIILMFLIIMECFYIGSNAPDMAGRLVACGFGFLLALQTFVNIGVVTKILPNTGLPLPFVSYGLSSLVSLFACVGIVLNIGLQRKEAG